MQELGFNINKVLSWFPREKETPYILVRVPPEHASKWVAELRDCVRRCYISDETLADRVRQLVGVLKDTPESGRTQIINSKLPDPGPTMAGDFGEILIYFYQAASAHPKIAFGPKKWRLKQDRTKPAPRSDVIHFILPSWPSPSEQDELLCAEVKLKSTKGAFSPIEKAIEGCEEDRTSRLSKTLVWLKERAICEPLGATQINHLDRFINATDHPPFTKRFSAIAVICSSLVDVELTKAPLKLPTDYTLVVVAVPNLHTVYNAVFDVVKSSTLPHEKTM
jgi:hypothetical protein